MKMPEKTRSVILENRKVAEAVCEMHLEAGEAPAAVPGQFLQIRSGDGTDPLLGRPLSVAAVRSDRYILLYQVRGPATRHLQEKRPGETLAVVGPLGSGFPLGNGPGRVLLVGGGIGVAPLWGLAEALRAREYTVDAILGYDRTEQQIRTEVFRELCDRVQVTTMDGSCGIAGHACIPLEEPGSLEGYTAVYACGPIPMLRSLGSICRSRPCPLYVSVEEVMACGIGACLGCAVRVREAGGTVRLQRVCMEGPVFRGEEVLFDGPA